MTTIADSRLSRANRFSDIVGTVDLAVNHLGYLAVWSRRTKLHRFWLRTVSAKSHPQKQFVPRDQEGHVRGFSVSFHFSESGLGIDPTTRPAEAGWHHEREDVEQPTSQPFESMPERNVSRSQLRVRHEQLIARFPAACLFVQTFVEHGWVVDFLGNSEQLPIAIAGNEIGHHRHASVVGVDHVEEKFDGTWNADDPKRTLVEL